MTGFISLTIKIVFQIVLYVTSEIIGLLQENRLFELCEAKLLTVCLRQDPESRARL